MHQLTRFDFTGPNGGGGGSLATKSCLTHATLGTYQVPLSMRFSRQGYWGGLPFPSPEDLPNQELNPGLLHCRWILSWLSHKGSPRILEWVASPSPGDLPNPGIKPRSPTLQADSLPAEPQGKPKNTGMGSLSLLQEIFPTQGSNPGLLHCRQIL